TNTHRKAIPFLHGVGDDAAAQGHFDGILDVIHADAVAGGLGAVDLDLQVRLAGDRLGNDVASTIDGLECPLGLLGDTLDRLQVRAENLDTDVRAHPRREHFNAVDNRLREDVAPARHL